jgi:bisphosphoglycerate-independent phosphoglycerate mutase (AlkP superfamily)
MDAAALEDRLERILLRLGPLVHRLESVVVPAMKKDIRAAYAAGKDEEGEALEKQLDDMLTQVRAYKATLAEVEPKYYALRRRRRT